MCCLFSVTHHTDKDKSQHPDYDDTDTSQYSDTNNSTLPVTPQRKIKPEKPITLLQCHYSYLLTVSHRTDQAELDLAADIENDMQHISTKLQALKQQMEEHISHLSHKADHSVLQHKQRHIEAEYGLSYDLSSSDDSHFSVCSGGSGDK